MSVVRHLFRKSSIFAGAFLLSVFLAGCQQADSGVPSAFMSPQGLKAEAFLPQTTFVVFELGAGNQQQQDAFNNLLKKFPSDDQQNFSQNVIQGFDKDLTTYNLDYQKDIVPAIGPNVRLFVGIEGTPSKQTKPDVYVFVPLQDPSKMDAIFTDLLQGGSFTQQDYNGTPVLSKTSGSQYMARVNDLLLITNDADILKGALDRQKSAQPSLIADATYQRTLQQLKPSVAFAYINVQGILNVLHQDPTSRTQFEQAFGQLPSGNLIEAIQGEMFSAQAEDNGIHFYGAAYGDEEKMKTMEQNFSNLPSHQPYLYSRVPGNSVMAYFETYNLEKVINEDFQNWSGVKSFNDGLTQLKQSFTQIGLDFDNDFMPLFDQGVALNIHHDDSIVPSFAFYADVGNHPDAANKVMGKLKIIVDVLLKDIDAKIPDSPGLFTNEAVTVAGGQAYVVRLHLDKLNSQNSNLATLQLFLTQPVEFWYGVTGDKLAFLALEPNFDQNYQTAQKVSDDQNFQHVTSQLGGLKSGVMYMSPATFVGYLDKIVQLAHLGSPADSQSSSDYDKVKSYLKPLTGAAFTTEAVSAGEAHFEGFLLIE